MNLGRSIKAIENIHAGLDIYVVASGKSLDYINPNFFENKLTIGVNQIFKKMKTNYLVYKDPKFLNKAASSGSTVFISKHRYGNTNLPINKIPDSNNVYVYDHNRNSGTPVIDFSNIRSKLIVSKSTITTSMHLAAHMGAKNIILVSHDCGLINGESNFSNYYDTISDTPWKNWNEYRNWLSDIESQTIEVKKVLQKEYNCNILSINPFVNYNLEGNTYLGKNKIN